MMDYASNDQTGKTPNTPEQNLRKALSEWGKQRGYGNADQTTTEILINLLDQAERGDKTLMRTLANVLLPKAQSFASLPSAKSLDPLASIAAVWNGVVSGSISIEVGEKLMSMAEKRLALTDLEAYRQFAQAVAAGEEPAKAAQDLLTATGHQSSAPRTPPPPPRPGTVTPLPVPQIR